MRLIDADTLIEKCGEWYTEEGSEEGYIGTLKQLLDKQPTIEPKQGEWKRRLVDNGFNADWVCSECGYRVKTDFVSFNFCPNCGAKMKGKDDEDNH